MAIATLAEFRIAHPEFVDACDDDIEKYLGLSDLYVNECWGDDMARGSALFAAHYIKVGESGSGADTPNIKAITSGSHKVEYQQTTQTGAADFGATLYGQLFKVMKSRYSRYIVRAI